ncbi:MG2 domain-containing protein [Hymenobacter glacialis]|uniref:Alpha-2-macroglobulin domain-containing protein n=1 Tax=Hymenobacter glacialis TaxID=1908236 RepID=A0A1G1SYD9_9BACT|nr:MG2 domain-containing protein [Hymenobacter glacialis]OGX83609.1 hypothetical protein BEN48_16930 [Hymenobacter glacialis]
MRFFVFACLLLMAVLSSTSAVPSPTPFAAQWKKIDALLKKGQTATAAPLVEAIYRQAKKEGNSPAYVRALLYKVRLLQAKEEDETEKGITLLEAELKTATFPARPIIHSLLAEQYTYYLNQNRYRLYQRTAGADPTTGPDASADGGTGLATWDMGRLGAAIVRHYYQSVEDEPQKQLNTSLRALGEMVIDGDAEGRALRPSLYDLLAHRAIEGLQNQELYVTRPEQQFQLTDPQAFGTAAEFAALRLLAPDADSLNGQLHALRLLQRLTASRQQLAPANRAALADVDLLRLDYLKTFTQGTDLAEQYEPALLRMTATYADLPISTEFMARRAEAAREDGDNVAAVKLARETEARFPKSRGAARARQLRESIEQPEIAFSATDIVVPNQPWRLDVTARNVTGLHAWAYRVSLREWEKSGEYDEKQRPVAQRYARALRAAPAASWTVAVPAHPQDYKEQKFAVAGAALPVGYYLVIISNQATKPTEQRAGAVTAYGFVGASELSAVNRRDADAGTARLLVLHRQSGAPLAGVQAQAAYQYYDRKARKSVTTKGGIAATTATGEVLLPKLEKTASDNNDYNSRIGAVRIWRGQDTLRLTNINGYYRPERNEPAPAQRRTFLFTDRAIYRPGQTLYLKGVLTETLRAKSSLVTGQTVSVRLMDVNGQTVQTLSFTTSDFGSFHGSLVLPTGLLNGEMSLQTDHGSLSFAVEDYKRPTFEVKIDSVPGRPALGQPLTLNGRARAYAGQPTDGAQVKYRITRRELWPMFGYGGGYGRGGYNPGGGRGTQEIAHGTTTTDAEGRFNLAFTPLVAPKNPGGRGGWEPGYLFEITADVTDAAGETRTGTRAIPIGRNPLSLVLSGPGEVDKQALPAFTLLSTNATGEPLPATGTLRLLARRYRPNPPGVPGAPVISPENELPAELLRTLPFDTKTSPVLNLKAVLATLPTGRYRLEAQAAGADTAARARQDFELYDSRATTVPFPTPDWFVALADTVAPGQSTDVLVGSSEAGARILLEVEREDKLLRQEWLTLNANEQRRLRIESGPATALGPLYIHTTQVRDGRLYRHTATVQVAEKPQPLQLSIATFRDRLQPGQRETWRVTIRQANGQPATAELLATLYDQSLDVFRPHSFMGLDLGAGYYPAQFGWQGEFGEVNSTSFGVTDGSPGLAAVDYPKLNTWQAMPGEIATSYGGGRRMRARAMSNAEPQMLEMAQADGDAVAASAAISDKAMLAGPVTRKSEAPNAAAAPDLSVVPTRTDFRETAFWQPALRTDKNGDIVLEFQMPEAVTRWQLLALAHDKNLRSGQLARQLVTQKEIQITPNAPRFLRQGDTFTFPAKFSNLTDHATTGTAQFFLLDAATGQDITSQLVKGPAQQAVSAAAHQSMALGWEISLPSDFAPVAVTYRVVAQSQLAVSSEKLTDRKSRKKRRQAPLSFGEGQGVRFSDGEENTLPVLPNRILITESLPLPIVGPGTREYELQKLTSTSSPTRRNYSLTLEMTANPAWYAVQSLPYLMEYPYECSEQIFSRLYANLIAAQILKANPRFKTVLVEWQRQAQVGTAAQKNALTSKLAQNQELKNCSCRKLPGYATPRAKPSAWPGWWSCLTNPVWKPKLPAPWPSSPACSPRTAPSPGSRKCPTTGTSRSSSWPALAS